MFRVKADRLVLNVVEGSDAAQIVRHEIHLRLFVNSDTLRLNEILNGVLDKLTNEIVYILGASACEVVEIGVRGQTTEHKSPR